MLIKLSAAAGDENASTDTWLVLSRLYIAHSFSFQFQFQFHTAARAVSLLYEDDWGRVRTDTTICLTLKMIFAQVVETSTILF